MAVKYVNDFSFPSDFGFHKSGASSVPGKAKGGHIGTGVKGRLSGHAGSTGKDSRASKPLPNARTDVRAPKGYAEGGKVSTPFNFRDGGAAQGPQSKYAGHKAKADTKPRTGAGSKGLDYDQDDKGNSNKDHIFGGTRGEKTSGVQGPAFKHGGKASRNASMHKAHMERRAKGGAISADIAEAPVPMGKKSSWNKDDAVSPGSYNRTPPKQSDRNEKAVKNKFASRDTEDATKQTGDVERMSGWSDYAEGGSVKGKGHMDRGEAKAMKRDRPRNMGANPLAPKKGDTKKSTTPFDYKKGGHISKKVKGVSEGPGDRFEIGPGGAKATAKKEPKDGEALKLKAKYAVGGSVSTPQPYKEGGRTAKKGVNIGPGDTFARGPSGEKSKTGDWSRIHNLGSYAHGGKVGSTQKPGGDAKYEKAAGTPKRDGNATIREVESGKAKGAHTDKGKGQGAEKHNGKAPLHAKTLAGGGLTRGTSAKKNAAIHAKSNKKGLLGALSALGGSSMPGTAPPMGGHQPSAPGMGPAPPGMAPGAGSPPGGAMGSIGPPPGMGAPQMSHGGTTNHFHFGK